jgi:hypothetical protein
MATIASRTTSTGPTVPDISPAKGFELREEAMAEAVTLEAPNQTHVSSKSPLSEVFDLPISCRIAKYKNGSRIA